MSKATEKATAREVTTELLRLAVCEYAPRDDRGRPVIYVHVATVSASGMTRRMRVYYVTAERELRDITGDVAAATGRSINGTGVRVDGCGMDMRFELTDVIARTIGAGNGNDIAWRTL